MVSEGRRQQAQREKGGTNGFTTRELAAYLGVTTRTIRRWQRQGHVPPPELRSENGWNIWTAAQAREVKAWVLTQR